MLEYILEKRTYSDGTFARWLELGVFDTKEEAIEAAYEHIRDVGADPRDLRVVQLTSEFQLEVRDHS